MLEALALLAESPLTISQMCMLVMYRQARHCAVGQSHSDSMETSRSERANSSQRTPGSSSERAKQIIELLIIA